MNTFKMFIVFTMALFFGNFAFAEGNVEYALRIQQCTHALYQETFQALTFSMVQSFCEEEKTSDLMKAADLWKSNGSIGFIEALQQVKELTQN